MTWQIADDSVVTKGVEIATKRAIALKKLITHNPRDGVCLHLIM